jgi:hypothetical protein
MAGADILMVTANKPSTGRVMIEVMRWLVVLVLAACGSKSNEETAGTGAASGATTAPATAPAGAPKLTDKLMEALLAAETDANDNPFDSLCTEKGGWTARYNKDPRGMKWAEDWVKQKGFNSFAQYRELVVYVASTKGVVEMRRKDPGYAPKRATPAEDIAIIGKYFDKLSEAQAARRPRLMPDCKK